MSINQPTSNSDSKQAFWLFDLYDRAIKNVPFLKYSKILIVTIIVLALIAYFKLDNSDVFYYSIGVIVISFLAFIFSLLIKPKSKYGRIILYFIITCIAITISAAILGFASYIFLQKPAFYKRWFPIVPDKVATNDTINGNDSVRNINKTIEKVKEPKVHSNKGIQGSTNSMNEVGHSQSQAEREGRIKISILPFEYNSSNSDFKDLSKGIPEVLLTTLITIDSFLFIEGVQKDKVLKEIDFQQGKYVDISTAVKIGKMLGAQKIIIGSCQINGSRILINGRVVNVQSGTIDQTSVVSHEGLIDNILAVQREFAQNMFRKLNDRL